MQQKHSELLSIVVTLNEFGGMFWGQKIKIYTDHQTFMRDTLGSSSNCVHCWRLLVEEYGPKIVHIKGLDNSVADTIRHLE